MDDLVGNLSSTLDSLGLWNNTFLALVGDNGAYTSTWPHRPDLFGGGSNWPLRGQKGDDYEGGTRTPGFVHSPLLKKKG